MRHDWWMPDSPAFGTRATTGEVTQRRCRRCLMWESAGNREGECSCTPVLALLAEALMRQIVTDLRAVR